MVLNIVPSDPNSVTKAFANLKAELDKEKATQITGQVEIDVLTRVVKNLKISADRFTRQISTLKDKIKHLENKVVDGLNEIKV
jgi:predicted  nucleic acid-binding Zn-ribbon protein